MLPGIDADINFLNVEFEEFSSFEGLLFSQYSHFNNATFSGGASFVGATFSSRAHFKGATFSGTAMFDRATFFSSAWFMGASFANWALFDRATFSYEALFDKVTFYGHSFFDRATFSDEASFAKTTFASSSTFVSVEMKGETSFEDAQFENWPPAFFGAKLHQGTVWRGIDWPKPIDSRNAGTFIDAYACLKLEMDRLKKHEDELDFFALELQSRRVLLGPLRGFPITLYGALSDYGRSYARPFLWLLAVAAIGTLVLLLSGVLAPWQSLGLSIANTLNVFGFRKDFFDARMIECLPAWLDVVAALQTILGTILLFLFGLGIRNKFRMK